MKLNRQQLFMVIFWVILITIFILSVIPLSKSSGLKINGKKFKLDYFEHFITYFALSLSYVMWKTNDVFKMKKKDILLYMVTGTIVGCMFEYIQEFVPKRVFNPYDLLFNIVGLWTGFIFMYYLVFRVMLKKP